MSISRGERKEAKMQRISYKVAAPLRSPREKIRILHTVPEQPPR
jgi:hypothetical protein